LVRAEGLRAHPDFKDVVHRGALALYLRYSYVPGRIPLYTRFQAVARPHSDNPADALPAVFETPLESKPYWSAKEVWINGPAQSLAGFSRRGSRCLGRIARDAVRLRMISDVPLAACCRAE